MAEYLSDLDKSTVERIALLATRLRESLRDLGLEPGIEKAAQKVPHAHERLRYVAALTEQAATTSLNNSELAQAALAPITKQAKEQSDHALAANADQINHALHEIILAQGFQDLTGQVIHKLADLLSQIDAELIAVLVQYAHLSVKEDASSDPDENPGLLNGPLIKPAAHSVTQQSEVDDLLAELGF